MNSQHEQQLRIENPRNYPDDSVARLRSLLNSRVPMRQDTHRPNFFEIDDEDRVFYVYISPATSMVIFLATWVRELEPEVVAG